MSWPCRPCRRPRSRRPSRQATWRPSAPTATALRAGEQHLRRPAVRRHPPEGTAGRGGRPSASSQPPWSETRCARSTALTPVSSPPLRRTVRVSQDADDQVEFGADRAGRGRRRRWTRVGNGDGRESAWVAEHHGRRAVHGRSARRTAAMPVVTSTVAHPGQGQTGQCAAAPDPPGPSDGQAGRIGGERSRRGDPAGEGVPQRPLQLVRRSRQLDAPGRPSVVTTGRGVRLIAPTSLRSAAPMGTDCAER